MAVPAHEAEGQWGVWPERRKILVVLAHPDDPEFFCGGTLVRWARAGHDIDYCLLTCGDKGYNDSTTAEDLTPDQLCALRHEEQEKAAALIGARSVQFFDHPDGYLEPDLELRRDIVRVIRKHQPDILVTCDPQTLFTANGINHPDHRAAGQAVLDAVFPASSNAAYFPELLAEGLTAYMPAEVWCSLTMQPTVVLDVTEEWPRKMKALLCHKSQVGDAAQFRSRMLSRRVEGSSEEEPRFEEKFRVVRYR